MTLAVIDYGAGNLHSVANALTAVGASNVQVTADAAVIAAASRIILPGVGTFGRCAAALRDLPGVREALDRRVLSDGVPFLGICVGMQLMAQTGEEMGLHQGLGWMHGTVRPLPTDNAAAKVPHMGWNWIEPSTNHPMIEAGEAYFVHSFAYEGADVLATTDHGGIVTAAIGRDNMVGVQFHPEKSQRFGLDLLRRFLAWRP